MLSGAEIENQSLRVEPYLRLQILKISGYVRSIEQLLCVHKYQLESIKVIQNGLLKYHFSCHQLASSYLCGVHCDILWRFNFSPLSGPAFPTHPALDPTIPSPDIVSSSDFQWLRLSDLNLVPGRSFTRQLSKHNSFTCHWFTCNNEDSRQSKTIWHKAGIKLA